MATYDEICQEHLEHLRKGREIQAAANKFVRLEPTRFVAYDPDEYGPDAMEVAFNKRHEWERELVGICRREAAARAAER